MAGYKKNFFFSLFLQGYEDMYTRIKRTRRTAQRQLPRGRQKVPQYATVFSSEK